MRLLALVMLFSCAPVIAVPVDAEARRACTSEGMWCQDADHSHCCRGLRCVDSSCVKREAAQPKDEASL